MFSIARARPCVSERPGSNAPRLFSHPQPGNALGDVRSVEADRATVARHAVRSSSGVAYVSASLPFRELRLEQGWGLRPTAILVAPVLPVPRRTLIGRGSIVRIARWHARFVLPATAITAYEAALALAAAKRCAAQRRGCCQTLRQLAES
jgi:hypothetical protein